MNRFRFALALGFGGMLMIFLAAGLDASRLIRQMRAENQLLREASAERSRQLTTVRSYVLQSKAYVTDYLLDMDERQSRDRLSELAGQWAQVRGALSRYPSSSLEEDALLAELRARLEQQWQDLNDSFPPSQIVQHREQLMVQRKIVPLTTAVVEITQGIDQEDRKQSAATQAKIQQRFERTGRELGVVLNVALAAALLLALGAMIYILRIERQINASRNQLEQLSARLVNAQEEERRSISRELHDEVGQTLGAVLVEAANLSNRIPPDDAVARKYLDNIRKQADSSINSIRNIALLLRPSMLDDLGLIPALEWQAREVSRRSGINVKVIAQEVADSLPDPLRTTIYRLVQEALNNVARHSGASSATVSVRGEGGQLVVAVEDDGQGFNPQRTRGLGLLGMEERVRAAGGRLEIESQPGKGTRLSAWLPAPSLVEPAAAV